MKIKKLNQKQMNTIEKIVFMIVLLAIAPLVGKAQSDKWMDRPAEERAEKLTSWMDKELSLNPAQKEEVYAINLKYAQKGDEVKNSQGSRMQKFQAIKEMDDAKDEELKLVFSEDQFSTYQDRKKELRQAVKDNMKERR